MSEEKQSKQIDEFIEKRVNVIVINPVKSDSEQIVEALSRAKNFGIRVIAVDSQLNNIKVDTSIVSDNYHAGILIAKDFDETYLKCSYSFVNAQRCSIS